MVDVIRRDEMARRVKAVPQRVQSEFLVFILAFNLENSNYCYQSELLWFPFDFSCI